MDKGRAKAIGQYKRAIPPEDRRCECCGWRMPAPLVARNPRLFMVAAHHIHAAGRGGGHDGGNLILLCPSCHEIADYLSGERVLRYRISTRVELLDELVLLTTDPDAWERRHEERLWANDVKIAAVLEDLLDG